MNASSSGTAGSWDNSLYLKSNNFANLSVGDVIYFTLTKNGNASGQAHVVLYYQNTLVKDAETTWPETEFTSFDTDGNYSYTITSDNLKYFKGYYDGECTSVEFINLAIKGYDFTLSKVSIKKHFSAIKTTLSDDDVQLGSWAAQYDVASSKLSNVKTGDYFYVPATKQMTKDDESAVSYWQAQFYYNWENLYNVNSVDHDIWAEIQEADVSNITSNDFHLKGEYYNCTGVYLLHPVNSFKIGSIGMATFSADQEVTVPEGLTAYKAAVSGNNVTLTPFKNNVIPANTGAIIKGDEGSVVEFVATTSDGPTEESALQAVTTDTNVDALAVSGHDLYVLYAGTGEKEYPLDLSVLLDGIVNWGGNVTVSDTEPYTAEWTSSSTNSSMGKWLGKDWSSYDKLRLVFTSNTVTDNVHFSISYDGHTGADTGADLAPKQLTVDIPLHDSYKSAIAHFFFHSNATSGSLTFASAALIDNDGATVAEFRKTTSGTLAANKAYLKLEAASLARLSIVFNDDDSETTGVLDVQKHTTQSDNVYYNLRGMKVDKPTKGLYIMNGKKVIVK